MLSPDDRRCRHDTGFGRGGGTRTRDLVLPKHVRYQATLLPAEPNDSSAASTASKDTKPRDPFPLEVPVLVASLTA